MTRQMPSLTIAELKAEQAEYAAICRRRDGRLGAVLLGGFVAWIIAIVGSLVGPGLRPLWLGVIALGGIAVAGDAVYVLGSSWRFHRAHAPRCPACDRSLTRLRYIARALDDLARFEGHPEWPAELREKVREVAVLRCPRCRAVVAAPAV